MVLVIVHFHRQSQTTNNINFNSTLQISGFGDTLTSFRIGSLNFCGNRALTIMHPFIWKILVFFDVTPCIFSYRCFWGTCCLHSKSPLSRRRHYVLWKLRRASTPLHGFVSQKTAIFIVTASNISKFGISQAACCPEEPNRILPRVSMCQAARWMSACTSISRHPIRWSRWQDLTS